VRNPEAVAAWVRDRFPSDASDARPARVASLAQFRNTKALPSDGAPVVQVRCWNELALLRDGHSVGAASGTAAHGVFTFVLEVESAYKIATHCAVIENPAVFGRFEDLGLVERMPLALYAGGRMPRRILSWLEQQNAAEFRVTHFPDYDPVGLSEYARVRAILGDRANLHVPADLEQRFRKFARRELLGNRTSQSLLAKLRSSALPEVQAVVRLIDTCNAGLEQEALLT
jgi:hypothetical protein